MAIRSISHRLTLENIAGVEVLFKDYMEYSARLELTHHLLLGTPKIEPRLASMVEKYAASVHIAKYWRGYKIPKILNLRKFYASHLLKSQKIDTILFWNNFGDRESLSVAKKSKCRTVFYDHGCTLEQPESVKNPLFLKELDGIIACSYASKRTIELRWSSDKEVRVVRNPLRGPLQNKITVPKKLTPNRKLKLGIAARLVPNKGIPVAVHALKALISNGIDVELHIAGKGPEKESLDRLIHKLDLQNRVIFKGVVDDMTAFYHDIDLFLAPSIREAFGLVALEAAAHGCPIICARVDGLPEIVRDGSMGYSIKPTIPIEELSSLGGHHPCIYSYYFDAEEEKMKKIALVDPKEFASAILKAISSSESYQKMSETCLKVANEEYRFDHYVKELEDAIIGE